MKPAIAAQNRVLLSHSVQSFCMTLAMFMLLPLMAFFSAPDVEMFELRSVDTLQIPFPPPPEQVRETEYRPEREPVTMPRTEQAPRVAPEPERMALPFRAALGAISGDFAINANLYDFDFETLGVKDAFELFDLDEAPMPLAQMPPAYPPGARAGRVEGEVRIEFVVNVDGTVENQRVVESSPSGVFDRAVLSAARRWRFRPGIRAGKPVRVRVQQSFRFVLDD